MVESFIDGDPERNYGVGYGTSHHNGDLKGVTKALPYIKSLGVNAVWLTPIFDSDAGTGKDPKLDATGYFARDYFEIDPKFGSFDDAREMVKTAHDLGLYVFLDGVFGHHKGGAKSSPSGKTPSGPKEHVEYPGSLEFFQEVATYWIDELEIDGWRLDQAYQIPVQYLGEIRESVEKKCRERKQQGKIWGTLGYMVAEVWNGEDEITKAAYGSSERVGLYSAFDFPMRYRLVGVLAAEENGSGGMPATVLAEGDGTRLKYPPHAIPNLMLTNHDLVRFGDLIQRAGYDGPESEFYWRRHKAAFTFMAAKSGPITIYYGDEIGAEVPGFAEPEKDKCWEKGLCDDHVARTSGKISGFSEKENDLRQFLTRLMQFREKRPALWKGDLHHVLVDKDVYVATKTFQDDLVLYALNISRQTRTIELPPNVVTADFKPAFENGARITSDDAKIAVELPALTGAFFVKTEQR